MTKKCPQCKKILEFNESNFRLSCDGYWRNTCRNCENRHKRMIYKHEKVKEAKQPNSYTEAREQRLQAAIDKYDKIFKILKRLGISPDTPAEYVDKVLENVSNRKSA